MTMRRLSLLVLLYIICMLTSKHSGATDVLHGIVISDTSYRIIHSENNTYGYEILINNRVLIRQMNIPGLPGNKGFATKLDAVKTARLVKQKLRQGIMPPTITENELHDLGIQN